MGKDLIEDVLASSTGYDVGAAEGVESFESEDDEGVESVPFGLDEEGL